jgi:hypothetical protein
VSILDENTRRGTRPKNRGRRHAALATTSEIVGPNAACMCGNGCMSMDGGFQVVRAAGENLQIRTLLFKKKTLFILEILRLLTIWWKAPFWLMENQKKKKEEKKKMDI